MRAVSVIACGMALTFAAGPSNGDIYTVETEGDHAIKGRIELSGEAVAVSPSALVTAGRVVGMKKDFRSAASADHPGLPMRDITIRNPRDAGGAPIKVTAGARPTSGNVVILIPDDAPVPLVPEPLSACPLVEGGTYELRAASAGHQPVGELDVFSAGHVTRFSALSGWDPSQALGKAVYDQEGRVAGIVTDAAPDGTAVEFTPIADMVNLLPQDAVIDCDPRLDSRDIAELENGIKGLLRRVQEAEQAARDLKGRVAAAEQRLTTAEQTGNFAVDVLADVATDLEKINATRARGGDISPMLESMKTRLQSLRLAPTVKTIDALLRRPDWSAGAKSLEGNLVLTFTYRTQLPGPAFSDSLRLCLRAIKPYKSSEDIHDFRTVAFYSKATTDDPERLVKCVTTNVNIPAGRSDLGQYVFEVPHDYLTDLFEEYRASRDWLPADYVWSGLTYAVLVKPGGAPGGQAEGAPDEVILHMLIIPPDDSRPGASAVQCRLFENEQKVIDLLALSDWASDQTAFDDVRGVILDAENTSDECVQASSQ